MTDNLSPQERHKTMKAVKGKATIPEKRLFSFLMRKGFRGWTKNDPLIFGKPDVAFKEKRIAIFIDGCFWHGCLACNKKMPKTNSGYWLKKIDRNKKQSQLVNKTLRVDGWKLIRIWEHELVKFRKIDKLLSKVASAINEGGLLVKKGNLGSKKRIN
jgi:DNA mismatch endonuclease (patch repair protein)